ncbi:formate/nitrite transporter family protein [Alphaproteobacteria bacterium GH1-50]|uniref:Formate/nitrite transporter family protein n=1 Tax=Kangsaoukella pontilimi TaxID=2691042 RepID=A0A7C9IR94_9RHOB|nr:formate/nitrite transporter family protein [Kangsaoukella pontilimi]MXQ06725.1 formate/nitrite transporter family protein [Kangsaoukella pontilimi]
MDDLIIKPKESDHMTAQQREESVSKASALPSALIYEIIRREGEEELARSNRSLVWSGVAAGLMMSFSVLGEAVFRTYLPDAPHRYLIENIGYSFGFLLVIMGRLQLFTENTITTVFPFLNKPCWDCGLSTLRLWSIVLAANVVGAFVAAWVMHSTAAIPEDLRPAILSLSEHATGMGAWQSFMRGIPAGILVAALVWSMPQASGTRFFVILAFTWLIAAGDFTHIIAGSVEMAYMLVSGNIGLPAALSGFFFPTLMGNIVGGTAIFTMIAYGQVVDELPPEE